jgi:hypothetical protein
LIKRRTEVGIYPGNKHGRGMVICDMPEQMEPIRAARLLEKWISFYGMDNEDDWEPEDYLEVKKYLQAMELAIGVLRGDRPKAGIKKAATLLEQWPDVHSMDDPDCWESEDFPFVQNALEAVLFAASFLKEL